MPDLEESPLRAKIVILYKSLVFFTKKDDSEVCVF
jgi:hypothetical protein